MITREPGKSKPLLNKKEKLDIIKQIRPLIDEGVQILIDDGILPYQEIDVLAFRIKEYLTRETRRLHKVLGVKYLEHVFHNPIKSPRRPKKLDIKWFDMYHAYYRTKLDPPQ